MLVGYHFTIWSETTEDEEGRLVVICKVEISGEQSTVDDWNNAKEPLDQQNTSHVKPIPTLPQHTPSTQHT